MTSSQINLIVTNFSGGKRHSTSSPLGDDELAELARLIDGAHDGSGVVVAIQEMTTDDPGLPTRAFALEKSFAWLARSSLVPRVSTAWYPLAEKWSTEVGPAQAHNEGLCVVTGDTGLALTSWSAAGGPAAVTSPTRVLDLPALEFASTAADDGDWLHASVTIDGAHHDVSFRPPYYRGSRDTDPRVAQACLLGWSDGTRPAVPVCVLVNVHLSTLSSEKATNSHPGRVFSPEAAFLRDLQLKIIARYVREVQTVLGLPAIVVGDFNAEPGSHEMRSFAERADSVPLLAGDVCWKCGTAQAEPREAPVYKLDGPGLGLTLEPRSAGDAVHSGPVCANPSCGEPRFTHKGVFRLVDNVFVPRQPPPGAGRLVPGTPRVDLSWRYSDHAAVIVPLTLAPAEA